LLLLESLVILSQSKVKQANLLRMAGKKKGTELSDRQIQTIARALADPRRYEILKRLGGERCPTPCSNVRDCVDVSPATLSHHMKELETAELVSSEKDGKFVNYTRQTRILRAFLDRLKADLT
jgi:ArsR family transcriptional regulator, arsenate/arsenite/antimonite-responsive transcriptional repressor